MSQAGPDLPGKLYVVATPIGNVNDMSSRAAEILGKVSIVAAEDTRRTGRLLSHIGVKTRLLSCHEHNESENSDALLKVLAQGGDIAIVSDAGTPLISDPGLRLVSAARSRGFEVVAVPGPSAVTAAISVSGLPTDRFSFEGFLPRRKSLRLQRLGLLVRETRTMVFFEAVHRIVESVAAMAEVFGAERRAVIARELTKLHETVVDGTLGELAANLGDKIPLLGEFVVVVAGAGDAVDAADEEVMRVFSVLARVCTASESVALCSEITGASRNRVYALTRL
jgi:16S rRNA (cytidine1402-2'-O)-methyltransferase